MAIRKKSLNLTWPRGGLDKRYAVQSQPPYTTPHALNVWNDATGRERGGSRPGLSDVFTTDLSDPVRLLTSVTYLSSGVPTTEIFCVSGASMYRSNSATTLTAVAGSILGSKLLTAAEYQQKLYIAQHDDDTSLSASTHKPYVYDPASSTIGFLAATDGTLPLGCSCVCSWRDRLIFGGGSTTPFGIFGSRQGDVGDWDYGEATDDPSAAFSLPLSGAGQIGDYITALIPHADNCLVVGCRNSLWIMLGDPNDGGQVANVSPTHGIIDRNAWCNTPDGKIVFLSHDGLYMIQSGCGVAMPVSLSREKLPQELLNISARGESSTDYAVCMAYDALHRGIYLFVTLRGSGESTTSGTHWFIDWETRSFWPMYFGGTSGSNLEPWTCHNRRNYTSSQSSVLFGCTDGLLRRFDTTTETDDGESFQSYVTLGPFGDSNQQSDVRLDQLTFILTTTSDDVSWEVYRGDTAQEAAEASADGNFPADAGELKGGRNYTLYPRVRGPYLYIKIRGEGVGWSYEGGVVVISPAGRIR